MTKIKYDKKLLHEICDRDKCIINFEKIEKYNRDINIEFICNCGNNYNNCLRNLHRTGAFCKECINKKAKEKSKKTCLARYGIENPLKSKEVREKSKKTCLERYGVENISQLSNKKINNYKYKFKEIIERDKCTINIEKIDFKSIDDKYKIEFTCNCGSKYIKSFNSLYRKGGGYCKECVNKNTKEKIKKTCLERYGVESHNQSQEVKENKKLSNLKNYGVEYVSQLQEIKDKVKETNLKRFGVEYPLQSKEVREKSKQTCLDKFGVEYSLQAEEVKEKSKQTCLERYGVESHNQSQEVKENKKLSNLKNYGVEYVSQLQEIKDKVKETNLKRYGAEYVSQLEIFKEKSKKTCLDKYGVEYSLQAKEVRKKSKKTCLDKYGVEYSLQAEEVREKIKQTCLDKYGVDNPSKLNEIKEKKINKSIVKYGVEHVLQSHEIREKSKQTCLDKYGVENPSQNAEISEKQSKNSYKLKTYIFPCSNIAIVQGYEPFLLEILIKEGYTYNDIITNRSQVPVIWYDKNDKKHRYYCDIFIPKINCIYEVKSTWTYEKDMESIYLKKQACINSGYLFKLYVFDSKGCIKDSL